MSGQRFPVSYYATSIDHFKALGDFAYEWAFELEVAPVPLPATLPLLFSGLAFLHLGARRRGA